MALRALIFHAFFFLWLASNGQKPYVLDLKPQQWELKPSVFYIDRVIDNRQDKKNAGDALLNDKKVPVVFQHSLEQDLLKMIDQSVDQDTSLMPLVLSIEKFNLTETGNISNHKASLNFHVKIFREKNGKRFQLYESSGSPYFSMRGPFPNAHEKNTVAALKNTLISFNEWINQNTDIPPLIDTVYAVFDPEPRFSNYDTGDTISWNDTYKLTWNDFKGKSRSSAYMAESNCIFTYRAEPAVKQRIMYLHIRLNACFDRLSSWVREGQQKPELLSHEQLHFDICELYIRSLKKRIKELALDPIEYDIQIQPLFDQVWNEYQEKQEKYDNETEHGIVKEKQQAWEKEIHGKLGE